MYENKPKKNDSSGLAKRIHYGFISKLNEFKDVELVVYGPGQDMPSKLVRIGYNKTTTFSYLVKKLRPDVILLYTLGNVKKWLPRDFIDSKIPKIMIECDWWYVLGREKSWYKEWGIDFIIHRGSIVEGAPGVPSTWLPFSMNEDDFTKHQKVPLRRRERAIGFVGRGAGARMRYASVYQNRFKCIEALQKNELLKIEGKVGHEKYPESIAKYVCCLSDCGRLHSPPAKTFEIMGSGTLLLTDRFKGYQSLFGESKVCKYYDTNRSNIVEVGKEIDKMAKSNIKFLQEIVDEGVKIVNEKHLDRHRIAELKYIIQRYLESGKIERLWVV
jgi:hypothetical protein